MKILQFRNIRDLLLYNIFFCATDNKTDPETKNQPSHLLLYHLVLLVDFPVTETRHQVVVHHSGCLHVGIHHG